MPNPLQLASAARLRPRRLRGRARVGGDVLAALQPRRARAVPRGHVAHARVDPAAAGGDLRGARAVSRPVALREHRRPAAHRAGGGHRRDARSARARDAAAADGRAAQRAGPLSDRAHLPDGGQPLRVPRVEGASPVQPARSAGRAGADHRRRRCGRAARAATSRAAGSGAWWACSTTIRRSRAACCRKVRVLGPIGELPRVVREVRRAQGDHRAAVGESRRAPARRRAVRERGRRGADRAVVRGPDQRPPRAHHDPQRRARRPARARSGRARQRGARRVARQSRGDGDRRGRLDRRRARAPDRALPSRAPRAVRHFGGRALRDPDGARRRLPAAAAGGGGGRRQARGAGRRTCSRASGRASSSTPARTSTCR